MTASPAPGSRGSPSSAKSSGRACAPGVGLSRLRALGLDDDQRLREEVLRAVRITLEKGFGKNHSLCHGDLGNLDFLLQASSRLDDPDLARQIGRFSRIVLSSFEN